MIYKVGISDLESISPKKLGYWEHMESFKVAMGCIAFFDV
jgi:hypothetical protein